MDGKQQVDENEKFHEGDEDTRGKDYQGHFPRAAVDKVDHAAQDGIRLHIAQSRSDGHGQHIGWHIEDHGGDEQGPGAGNGVGLALPNLTATSRAVPVFRLPFRSFDEQVAVTARHQAETPRRCACPTSPLHDLPSR